MGVTVRVTAGQLLNLLSRGVVTVTSEDANLTKAGLSDGDPQLVYRAAAAVADLAITVDGDLLGGRGNFETWGGGSPEGWTEQNVGSGDVVQEGTIVKSGASSARLAPGATGGSVAQAYRAVECRSGEFAHIKASLRGDATGIARLRVFNPRTGHYLQSDGTWTASVVDLATQQAASWLDYTQTFQVESYAACLAATVSLRVIVLSNTLSALAYADDVELFPGIDLATFHGAEVDPAIAIQLRSSSDNFGAVDTLEQTITAGIPSFYGFLSSRVYRRYWRVKFVGTNTTPIEIGELVLGQTLTLQRGYKDSPEMTEMEADVASEAPGGALHVRNLTKWPRRVVAVSFRDPGTAAAAATFEERRDEVFHRCRGRRNPLVIIPDAARSEVLHGRIDRRFRAVRRLRGLYDENDIVVSESPFALATS